MNMAALMHGKTIKENVHGVIQNSHQKKSIKIVAVILALKIITLN